MIQIKKAWPKHKHIKYVNTQGSEQNKKVDTNPEYKRDKMSYKNKINMV